MKEKQKKLLKALIVNFGIVTKACKESGVSSASHYRWMQNSEEYATAVNALTDHYLDFVEDKLYELIEKGNATAILFYMKTKGKKRGYSTSVDVEVKGELDVKWEEIKTYEK